MNIKDLIKLYNDKDSLYKNKLTNHLNMGLYAMYRMGALEERLHQYAKGYIKYNELPLLPPIKYDINRSNFMDYVGLEGSYSSFIPYFERCMNGFGIEETIHKYINLLLKGSAGGAFHGLIRIAYALELRDRDELIKAFSYMAECYKEFEPSSPMRITDNPVVGLLNFSDNEHFLSYEFKRPLIIGRMEDIYEDREFLSKATSLDRDLRNFDYMIHLIVQLYGMTGDFTILHGVTSTYALYVIKDYINDLDEMLNLHWFHLQLAYCSTGCVEIKEFPNSDTLLSWEDLFKEAVEVLDVHTIKLVYALSQLGKITGDDKLMRHLANLKLKKMLKYEEKNDG